jgi:ATP synthase protein I
MNTINKLSGPSSEEGVSQREQDSEVGDEGDDFKPLTLDEAREWRKAQKPVSIWRILVWQCAAMVLSGLVAWWLTGVVSTAWSVVYGGAAVVLPSVVMAWGVTFGRLSGLLSLFAQGSLAAVVFWEGVKILLSVAMLALAPLMVANLNWLALVAGLVLVLKVYWLAFFLSSRALK